MEYRTLGRTGVEVSAFCLGAMMFGSWGSPDEDECVRIIHAALDAGINFLDTADVYSEGESEEIVGRALKGRRDDVVLATKVHGEMGPGRNQRGNSRMWIFQEVENSLRRLQTDHIDLYQLHRPDPATDIEEQLGALTDLVRQGKIRYFGCSTFPSWQIVLAEKQEIPLQHLALAFVLEHPGVTSAIIGPRTMEQLEGLLSGADVRLPDEALDRIDGLVPPGTVVLSADRGWEPPWMAPEARRRR